MRTNARGISQAETLIIGIALVACGALAFVARSPNRKINPVSCDSMNLRSVHTALILHAQDHHDRYPLPSLLDANNATLDARAETKNTTENIYAFLIHQGLLTPEVLVSWNEVAPNIRVISEDSYDLVTPPDAVDPANALWDPRFNSDFSDPDIEAHSSYSHLRPTPDPFDRWNAIHATADQPILSTRAPQVLSVDRAAGVHTLADPASRTFELHGKPGRWEGHVTFNDGHIEYFDRLSETPQSAVDPIFIDGVPEGDRFISIFVESGMTDAGYQAIWD